jgi:hypothetical protein
MNYFRLCVVPWYLKSQYNLISSQSALDNKKFEKEFVTTCEVNEVLPLMKITFGIRHHYQSK